MTQVDDAQPALDGCYHCGLPIPRGDYYPVCIDGDEKLMCCPGCQAVATAIVDGGLASFYRFRTETNERPSATELDASQWNIYDLPEVQAEFVTPVSNNLRQANLLIEGITCAACSWLIETHLKAHHPVQSVIVNATTHRCSIVWEAQQPLSEIFHSLASIGYTPRPATDEQQQALLKKESRVALFRIGVAGFGMMQAMMVAVGMYTGATDFWLNFLRWLSMLVATPVVFFSAWPFFQAAWRSIRLGHLVMDVPVALAIGLAYGASVWATLTESGEVYFESVSMFTFFLLLGRYIELRARHRNRLAFGNLAQLMPLTACCVSQRDGVEVEQNLPLKALKIGDVVAVKPGETFPCDGVVIRGHSAVVEAVLTGESRPVAKAPGDSVIAGTLNQHSPLRIEVAAVGAQTQLSAIERLATQAADEKPVQVQAADRIARFFIARLLVICIAVYAFWSWYRPEDAFWITLSVLVVTCPCALALAVPAALSAAMANLRKRGFLVARGHVIEGMTAVNRIIFDKTGTLTQGKFAVETVVPVETVAPGGRTSVHHPNEGSEKAEREHLLALAAALEEESNHPLAAAFEPWKGKVRATEIRQHTAEGVEGIINGRCYRLGNPTFCSFLFKSNAPNPPMSNLTWLMLADETGPLAWFGLADELKPDAAALIEQLKNQAIAVELLSGDQELAVKAVADKLGIDAYTGAAKPADKLAQLAARQKAGDKVLMVGDGINDVPVLAGADVSIAMASASDLAQTRADAVLLNDRLKVIGEAIVIARRTQSIIKQNLRFSLVYNMLAVPLAAAGMVPPWLAAIGMTASSLIVIFNALRLVD